MSQWIQPRKAIKLKNTLMLMMLNQVGSRINSQHKTITLSHVICICSMFNILILSCLLFNFCLTFVSLLFNLSILIGPGLVSISAAWNSLTIILKKPKRLSFVRYLTGEAPGSRWEIRSQVTCRENYDEGDDEGEAEEEGDVEEGETEDGYEEDGWGMMGEEDEDDAAWWVGEDNYGDDDDADKEEVDDDEDDADDEEGPLGKGRKGGEDTDEELEQSKGKGVKKINPFARRNSERMGDDAEDDATTSSTKKTQVKKGSGKPAGLGKR